MIFVNGDDKVYPSTNNNNFSLSKREYFAAMIIQGMLSNSIDKQQGQQPWWNMPSKELAEIAVRDADALIEALNKQP